MCGKGKGTTQGRIHSDVKSGSLLLPYKYPYMKGILSLNCQAS